jgi:hypothetical protein
MAVILSCIVAFRIEPRGLRSSRLPLRVLAPHSAVEAVLREDLVLGKILIVVHRHVSAYEPRTLTTKRPGLLLRTQDSGLRTSLHASSSGTFQIRSAYSRTERSLLKRPQRATFRMDIRVHASWSRYAASTWACVST